MLMITDSNDDAVYDHLTGRWPNAHPGGRHSAKANTLFVDGHVKAYLVPKILNQEQLPYFENQN
jgi:prepilin-type processing-associated H-X9-DG protein